MLTEDEAKTKWCPFARVLSHTYAQDGKGRSYEGGYSYNRSVLQSEVYMPTSSMCIGSACMAWRWEPVEKFEERQEAYEDSFNIGGITSREDPSPRGYCGLAGRPE